MLTSTKSYPPTSLSPKPADLGVPRKSCPRLRILYWIRISYRLRELVCQPSQIFFQGSPIATECAPDGDVERY